MSRDRPRDTRKRNHPEPFVLTYELHQPVPTKRCAACKGHYIDDPDGRKAHVVVFGHGPREPDGAPSEG